MILQSQGKRRSFINRTSESVAIPVFAVDFYESYSQSKASVFRCWECLYERLGSLYQET